jgi:hypothetical protein
MSATQYGLSMKRPSRRPMEIGWKEFIHAEAEKLGISPRAMRARLERGRHLVAGQIKRGPSGRIISVLLPPAQP